MAKAKHSIAIESQGNHQSFVATNIFMSQQIQTELKEEIELCRDIAKEVYEEDCHDTLDSVATLIKANGTGTLS